MKKSSKEILHHVEKSKTIGEGFSYFLNREWVFDNASAAALQRKLEQMGD
jgi:putative flippase GtrA